MSAIEIHGLSKRFGDVVAVDDLSFDVRAGAVTGFLGPNGAGKSTTLRMLLGLVAPTGGGAVIDGRSYAELNHPARRVGAVLESESFHPGRRARDHLRVLATAAELPLSRVDAVLDEVGLSDAAGRRIKGFSLGMRQRLGLAGALLGEPDVLILDEPANGLDPEGITWLRQHLRAFAARGGTVLVSSHLLTEVAQTVDDVVIIACGRLVTQSSLAELSGRTRSTVRVRTPHLAALRDALGAQAIMAEAIAPDTLIALDTTADAVGLAAAGSGAVVYELSPERLSLEDVFLQLTGASR
jgi:ABC-2 type transport system ATP-binding protein